jgi:hypothetical protein
MMGKRCCAWLVVVLTEENVCENSLTVAKTTCVKAFDLRNWGGVGAALDEARNLTNRRTSRTGFSLRDWGEVGCCEKPKNPPNRSAGLCNFKGPQFLAHL